MSIKQLDKETQQLIIKTGEELLCMGLLELGQETEDVDLIAQSAINFFRGFGRPFKEDKEAVKNIIMAAVYLTDGRVEMRFTEKEVFMLQELRSEAIALADFYNHIAFEKMEELTGPEKETASIKEVAAHVALIYKDQPEDDIVKILVAAEYLRLTEDPRKVRVVLEMIKEEIDRYLELEGTDCKQTGRNYNDPFNGAGALTARRLNENGESGAGEERERGAVENAD